MLTWNGAPLRYLREIAEKHDPMPDWAWHVMDGIAHLPTANRGDYSPEEWHADWDWRQAA